MAQLIKPGSVKVITENGEVKVSITLDLNINLNSGNIQVSAQSNTTEQQIKQNVSNKKESDDWLIPDFGASPKLNFGK